MQTIKKEGLIEHISHEGNLMAIVVRADYHTESVKFLTPGDFPLQMGYMSHPKGYEIQPHVHQKVERKIGDTQEVLLIKYGRVKVDFFSASRLYLESRELTTGDMILLASQGHGFTMLEPTAMIEIKSGPYLGEKDKIRFHHPDRKEREEH